MLELVGEGIWCDENSGILGDYVEKLYDIAGAHANASETYWFADVSFLGRSMNVNVSFERIFISRLNSFEPDNAGDNRIAPGGIDRDDLAGWNAAFENGSCRSIFADFFLHFQNPDRRGIRARIVPEAKFRGGNGVDGNGESIPKQDHLLIRSAHDNRFLGNGEASLKRYGYQRQNHQLPP